MSAAGSIECAVQEKVDRAYARGAKYRWDIVHGEQKYDAYDLAKECFDCWQQFLGSKRLLNNENGSKVVDK
jgi:hypothetical protein